MIYNNAVYATTVTEINYNRAICIYLSKGICSVSINTCVAQLNKNYKKQSKMLDVFGFTVKCGTARQIYSKDALVS